LAGVFASAPSLSASANPLSAFFGGSVLFFIPLLVFAPVLTMRLLAEERHTGTLEPLLTAPITTASVVLGKYMAALVFWIGLWLPTLMYVWITSQFGRVDLGAVLASYLGVFGIGLYYMAIGLAMSALAKNQIVAALLTFMVLSGLFAVGLLSFLDTFAASREAIDYVSLWGHMQAFSKGIVDTRYLVFDVSLAGLFVYLAWRALEGRSWQ
jgi:ABC-2 type transport system permease protein